MNDFEFLLFDRIEKIKQINEQYDLENNAYISFSGGKDSTILHYLIDLALPNNKIPRVFINTGIEYLDIVNFVKDLSSKDDRFVIINSKKNIKQMLENYGYPFKSKQHSHNVAIYQRNKDKEFNFSLQRYLNLVNSNTLFKCPQKLLYQFKKDFNIKISDECCNRLKKKPIKVWELENNKNIVLTGMRKEEGGQRKSINCIITDKENNLVKFHPLLIIDDNFENNFINKYNIKLCKLYYPPFNFERTGYKGCPFSLKLQDQLDTMEKLLPNEYKQCEIIWKPVYDEYRRIGYRLKKYKQLNIFDIIE